MSRKGKKRRKKYKIWGLKAQVAARNDLRLVKKASKSSAHSQWGLSYKPLFDWNGNLL